MPPRSRLAWAWTAVILALCWIPRFYLGRVESVEKPLFVPNLDKVVHLGIFAVFGYLWMRVGTSTRRAWWVFLAGVALAIISELGQELKIVSRDATLGDGLADSLGVIIGIGVFELVRNLSGKRPSAVEG